MFFQFILWCNFLFKTFKLTIFWYVLSTWEAVYQENNWKDEIHEYKHTIHQSINNDHFTLCSNQLLILKAFDNDLNFFLKIELLVSKFIHVPLLWFQCPFVKTFQTLKFNCGCGYFPTLGVDIDTKTGWTCCLIEVGIQCCKNPTQQFQQTSNKI